MAKNGDLQQQSQANLLNTDLMKVVEALTAAISSLRRDVPEPSEAAKAAAIQYGLIKGVLRTHSEPIPKPKATQG